MKSRTGWAMGDGRWQKPPHSPFRRRVVLAALACFTLGVFTGNASAQDRGAAALGSALQGLGVNTRVLMIGAHPDDEDTQVIAWLSRGRHVETAYLSLTRGDGGQNVIGNELGEGLGVIRTEELLAARRVDGGTQYFTRAYDYGFSKNADEAFTQWPHDALLLDVMTVVRAFKPHVIISVFTGTTRDGHGQHQASGIVAREAYDLAADTVRFPRSATAGHGGWTVSKFYRGGFTRTNATFSINVGEYDPLLGRSYGEIAAISRSQHRSQAFGTLQPLGVRMDGIQREAVRVPAPEDATQERGLFDGIDTTWARFRGNVSGAPRSALDSLPAAFTAARNSYDPFAPWKSIPALARIQRHLATICPIIEFLAAGFSARADTAESLFAMTPADFARLRAATNVDSIRRLRVDTRACVGASDRDSTDLGVTVMHARKRLNHAVILASGLAIEATVPRELWGATSAEAVAVRAALYNRGRDTVTISSIGLRLGGSASGNDLVRVLAPDSVLTWTPNHAFGDATRMRWLVNPRRGAMYDYAITGRDEASYASATEAGFHGKVGNATFWISMPVVYRYADQVVGEVRRPIAGVPDVSVHLDQELQYAPARMPIVRDLRVELRGASAQPREVQLEVKLPLGLRTDNPKRTVTVPPAGTTQTVTYTVHGTLSRGRHTIDVVAREGGVVFAEGYTTVDYEHITARRMYRRSRMTLEAVDIASANGMRVGYIAGVSDNSATALEQLGIDVTMIDPASLPNANLRGYTAIVIGPRAYETQPALVANNRRLLDYARAGGTLVVQYGQYEMQQPGIMPYPVTINRPHDRVTDENAPVTIIDSTASILRTPNRITSADFSNWLQDRSLYMPRTFDSTYVPILEMNDPGEPARRGALLIAPLGQGTYVYTTLAFFRQLPNGVPGAARLFVNLLAAKAGRTAQ